MKGLEKERPFHTIVSLDMSALRAKKKSGSPMLPTHRMNQLLSHQKNYPVYVFLEQKLPGGAR